MVMLPLRGIFCAVIIGLTLIAAPCYGQIALTTGPPLERDLAGGERHTYTITVAAGQFLFALVEQNGIDVIVSISTPNGQKLTEVNSLNGDQGLAPLMLIAESAGD